MTVSLGAAQRRAGFVTGLSLVLPVTLAVMGSVLLAPIVPKLFQQFGHLPHANYWVPSLLTVPALCIALFSPFVGILADRFGRRRLLIASMLVYGIMGLAPLVLDNFWAILATRVGVGICEAVVLTCSTALIGDTFDDAGRDRWLGNQAATASTTALLLFPIAGWLGDAIGWRGPFLVYGASLIFLTGILLFTWEPKCDVAGTTAGRETRKHIEFPWRHMLTACAVSVVGGILFFVVQFQMASAMNALGVRSSANTGWLIAMASVGVPLGAIAFGFIKKHCSVRTLLMVEFGVMALTFYGMAHATEPRSFVVPAFFNQIGAGLLLPTLLTWAMQPLAYEIRGRGTGIWQATYATAQFLSTLSFSFVMARVSGIQGAFTVFAALSALSFIVLTLAPIGGRRIAGEPVAPRLEH